MTELAASLLLPSSGTQPRAEHLQTSRAKGPKSSLSRSTSLPGAAATLLAADHIGHMDPNDFVASRIRGRPAVSLQRSAGLPSGAPLPRHFMTKLDDQPFRERRDDKGVVEFHLMRARWQSLKHETTWNTSRGTNAERRAAAIPAYGI
mmetsp:Transcript_11253/g.20572  ORF Transcript_11253/g.20572 Transcript_11253/m.20572 type:complete len:148 (+) Transcript_11253:53-496(+)